MAGTTSEDTWSRTTSNLQCCRGVSSSTLATCQRRSGPKLASVFEQSWKAAGALNRRSNSGLTHVESTPLPVSLELSKPKRKEGAAAMKQQAIHFVGLDVHQSTVVASVRDESGKVVMKA